MKSIFKKMAAACAVFAVMAALLLYGAMAVLLLWKPRVPAAALLMDMSAAGLKRKTTLPVIRRQGFLFGAGAVLLAFGMTMAASPREFCGGVLAVMTAAAVFSAVEGGRLGALIRGILPAVSLLCLLF